MIHERDSQVDNIKLVLLFLVALAHTLIPFRGEYDYLDIAIKLMYFCHMPTFAYITGSLVSKSRRNMCGYIKKSLVPYLCFQGLYVIIGFLMSTLGIMEYSSDTMTISFAEPSSPLYFLLCMIAWRMICPIFDQLKTKRHYVFLVLVTISLVLSMDSYANTVIMPIFSLLPFFYLGYTKEVKNDKDGNKALQMVFLLGVWIISAIVLPYETILFRVNAHEIEGSIYVVMLCKVLFFPIALCCIKLFTLLIPKNNMNGITDKAQNGMIIYIGSSF